MPGSPFFDQDLEQAVLGRALLAPHDCEEVASSLTRDHFEVSEHRIIFDAVLSLTGASIRADAVSVAGYLKRTDVFGLAGGGEVIANLMEMAPASGSVTEWVRSLSAFLSRRKLLAIVKKAAADLACPTIDTADITDAIERGLLGVQTDAGFDATHIKDALSEAMKLAQARKAGGRVGRSSGLKTLDAMTDGLVPGSLIVVAGRPSMGKTSLALNMLSHTAKTPRTCSVLFSMEMGREQIAENILASHASVSGFRLRRLDLDEIQSRRVQAGLDELSGRELWIDDAPSLSPQEIRSRLRRIAAKAKGHALGLVAIDYLQRMHIPGSQDRQREVAEISAASKTLAKEFNVPVLLLSQLNRAAESRDDRRPRMADLRDSGAIEQDADQVILLFRPSVYGQHKDATLCELIVGKNRIGPTGSIPVTFHGDSFTFSDRGADPF